MITFTLIFCSSALSFICGSFRGYRAGYHDCAIKSFHLDHTRI